MTDKKVGKMATKALEQILKGAYVPEIAQSRLSRTIDTYVSGTTALYTGKILKPFGSGGSGFQRGGWGNIRRPLYKNEDITIQERFDFSGHNNSLPHYNLDYGKYTKGLLNTINNSNNFSPQEKRDLLSDLHSKNLFDKD